MSVRPYGRIHIRAGTCDHLIPTRGCQEYKELCNTIPATPVEISLHLDRGEGKPFRPRTEKYVLDGEAIP